MSEVLSVHKSPYAKLKTVPVESVKVRGFMGSYLERLVEITLPTQYELLEKTGRIDNFRIAAGKMEGDYKTYFPFDDTDAYKWIEAVSFALATKKVPNLKKTMDAVILEIKDAQDEDGYLNTYLSGKRKGERWKNLAWNHELYCAGHLIQAAIANKRVTGDNVLFEVAKRFADHIYSVFGPGKREGAPGHPEVEMALVELYRETGDKRYLDLAKYFIYARGKGLASVPRNPGPEYFVDHKPFVELEEVTGHAVRMLYLCCGATDLYLETGDEKVWQTLNRLWENFVTKKMYITGGAGSRHDWESFGEEYELPNRRSYAETCASVANFMWNFRMFLATGDGKFVDVMEQTLYNGLLSGISLDGRHYFYYNPLEDSGKTRRKEWFDCACCPPNIARLIASFPGYVYTTSQEGIWVNFYEESSASVSYEKGVVTIEQETDYPWNGEISITLKTDLEKPFSIFLRIPGWASDFSVKINGETIHVEPTKGYLQVTRQWRGTNTVELHLPMKIEFIESHPFARDNLGKVAVKRGPVVYCAEQTDNPDFHVWSLLLDVEESVEPIPVEIKGNRAIALKGRGKVLETKDWAQKLYRKKTKSTTGDVEFILIPYHMWANREAGPMAVWFATT